MTGMRADTRLGGLAMPVIGIGTWQSSEEEIEVALTVAIDAGYRHIDTAAHYQNEAAIGKALKKIFAAGKVRREDLFIVTKLPLIGMRGEDVEVFLKKSLESLQLDYVDLYLVHHPIGFKNIGMDDLFPKDANGKLLLDMDTDHLKIWKAMEAQVDAGRTKHIGLSNFNQKQIQRVLSSCRLPVANLQVELHVYLQQKELVSFCKQNHIVVCAYSPLGSPGSEKGIKKVSGNTEGLRHMALLDDPTIGEIAKKHNKLPAQVLLRYLLQYGVAVIPKSSNPERIKQNINVFDFELTSDEFEKISALDRGEKGRIFNNTGILAEMITHPEYPHPIH